MLLSVFCFQRANVCLFEGIFFPFRGRVLDVSVSASVRRPECVERIRRKKRRLKFTPLNVDAAVAAQS